MQLQYKIVSITLLLSCAAQVVSALDKPTTATSAAKPTPATTSLPPTTSEKLPPPPPPTKPETPVKQSKPEKEMKDVALPDPQAEKVKEEIKMVAKEAPMEAPKAITKPGSQALMAQFEKVQKELLDLINEAEKYVKNNPAEKEKILEQIGMVFGLTIGGLEKVSGEKLIPDLETIEATAPTIKKPTRPTSTKKAAHPMIPGPKVAQPTEPRVIEKKMTPKPISTPSVKPEAGEIKQPEPIKSPDIEVATAEVVKKMDELAAMSPQQTAVPESKVTSENL